MKQSQINELVRHIIKETLSILHEEHDKGEWWVDESGSTIFADGDVGDSNHEAVVIQSLSNEILSHFGIDTGMETGYLREMEDDIKQVLIDDDRFDEKDQEEWESRGPSEVILKKLIEDKVYTDLEQAEDAVYIAYGNSSRDARNYAMKYWRWKVMKTQGNDIEIQTWHLTPDDIGIIVRGISEIMGEHDPDDSNDPDNEVGSDGYPGPRVNVTVQASGKRFSDIPLEALEKKMPQNLHNYRTGAHVGYTENIRE